MSRQFSDRANKVTVNTVTAWAIIKLIEKLEVSTDGRKLGLTPDDRVNMLGWFRAYIDRAGAILNEEIPRPDNEDKEI